VSLFEPEVRYHEGIKPGEKIPVTDEEMIKIINGTLIFEPVESKPKDEGRKLDDGKIPLELLPFPALREVAKVLSFGRKKYDSWNWSKGMAWSRLIGACKRHLGYFECGVDIDNESKLLHIAHLVCCGMFLLTYQLCNLGVDDRHKGFKEFVEQAEGTYKP